MKLFKNLLRKRIDDKGVTLVELLCTIAILSLVGTAVVGMIMVSSRTYQRGLLEIEVQQEAQFAANLIGDLLKDAKEVVPAANPSDPLVIKKDNAAGGVDVYEITHRTSDNTMWLTLNSNTPQLMAERIDDLPVVSSMGGNTYTVDMQLTRSDAVNTLAVSNTNNARNQAPEESAFSTDVSATILAPSEMVLEPNQVKAIEYAVTGISNKNVIWSVSGNSDGGTRIEGNNIRIGAGETSSVITITGETVVRKSNGSPAGSTVILVYIRRVTGFSMVHELISGTDGMAGARYKVSVNLSGLNLEKKPTMETDYVSPYKVVWSHHFYVNGSEVWNSWDYYSVTVNSGESAGANYAIVTLNRSMDAGTKFIITASALHPKGTYSGAKTNKSGLSYTPSFSDSFTLEGHLYTLYPGNFYRGSDQAQGSLEEWNVKQLVGNSNGIDPNQLQVFKELRYKVRGTNNWTSWITLNEGGNAIRIHEDSWMFACDKDYDIEVRFGAKTWDGRKFYPTSLGESAYTIRTGLDHARIKFDVSTNMYNATAIYGAGPIGNPIRMSVGTNLNFNVNLTEAYKQSETGLRWDRFSKSLIIKIQRLDGGTWRDVQIKYRNDWGNVEVRSNNDGQRDLADMGRMGKYFTFNQRGTYRILVGLGSEMGGDQIKLLVYNEGGRYFETRPNNNYYLWNESTGEGIFYVRVE